MYMDDYKRWAAAELEDPALTAELQKIEGAIFESCQLTDSRMYLKVVNPRLQAEVAPGDIVQSGVIISNSEVGQGSVSIQPLIYRLVCSNGMVVNDAKASRRHVGRQNELDGNVELYASDTLEAMDTAFIKQIRDTVAAAVDQTRFDKVIDIMKQARDAKLNTQDIPNLVQLTGKSPHRRFARYRRSTTRGAAHGAGLNGFRQLQRI